MLADKITIIYVDDEENNLFSFKATFRIKYKVLTALSGDEALKLLEENTVNIIVTDQRMPGMTGVEFLEKVIEKYPDPVRILLTGYADMNAVVDAGKQRQDIPLYYQTLGRARPGFDHRPGIRSLPGKSRVKGNERKAGRFERSAGVFAQAKAAFVAWLFITRYCALSKAVSFSLVSGLWMIWFTVL